MVEAKQKEQAILRLYEKYPYLNCLSNIKDNNGLTTQKKKKIREILKIV